jgi:undecaprenyl-diphosphatase
MSLLWVVFLASLQGMTEVLPVSRSGHEVVARFFLDGSTDAQALEGLLQLGSAVALVVLARRRLAGAFTAGVRAITQPSLFSTSLEAHDARVILLASGVSLAASALVTPRVALFRESPTATGVGLCLTGLAIASTARVPPRAQPGGPAVPSLFGALAVGLAHGLAAFPGASRVGAALTVLLWLGVKPARALDLAFLVTVPTLVAGFVDAAFVRASWEDLGGIALSTVTLGLVFCFASAAIASELLRLLLERQRAAVLSLWIVSLGLATLAYARALPSI